MASNSGLIPPSHQRAMILSANMALARKYARKFLAGETLDSDDRKAYEVSRCTVSAIRHELSTDPATKWRLEKKTMRGYIASQLGV